MPEEWIRFWHPTSMQNGPGATTLYALQNAKSQNADGSLDFVPLAQWPHLFAQDPVTQEWYWEGTPPVRIPAMWERYNQRLAAEGKPLLPRLGIPVAPITVPPAPPGPAPVPVQPPVTPPVSPTSLIPPGYSEPITVSPETGGLTTQDGHTDVFVEPDTGTVLDRSGNEVPLERAPVVVLVSNRSLVLPLLAVGSVAGVFLLALFRKGAR